MTEHIEQLVVWRPLMATGASILLLLFLILRLRMNAFAALLTATLVGALTGGLAPEAAFETIRNGVGGTLGFIAVVIGLGAIFGAILEATGGLDILAERIRTIGKPQGLPWWFCGLGLVAAIPVFFDVALIILAPLVFSVARRIGRNPMVLGLPLIVGLAAAHAFIPPTPGPIAIASLLHANLGLVILYGAGIGLVAAIVGGPLYVKLLEKLGGLGSGHTSESHVTPRSLRLQSASTTIFLILLPLLLIILGTIIPLTFENELLVDAIVVIGHPFVALLVACAATLLLLRPKTQDEKERIHRALQRSLEPTGAVILVTGAGGAFKQVLVDTGAGSQLADVILGFGLTPLFAAYIIAVLVRVTQGSATVAMITAAGLVAPITELASLSESQLALVAIVIAAGATAASHVNDSGFWLVSRIFSLSERETLRTWTIASSIISVMGLLGAVLLYPLST